ncbi:PRP45 [Candida margitis]|uniref:PRP45 n=1 Tax=Candida margitis TaxID=1775924 RepID=UPI00222774D9|nr:PRP45 [Candida margitis]KAI5952200.1 PRP45 [Candida margitis]
MFSSLLPRPKHSNYNPKLHYTASPQNKTSTPSTSALTAPRSNYESVLVLPTPDSTTTNRSKAKTYDATIPLKIKFPNLIHHFPIPPPDSQIIEETRAIFTSLLDAKLGTQKKEQTTYISYTGDMPSNVAANGGGGDGNGDGANADADVGEDKIIQIETMQEDPLLPPKHKLRKNRHERHDQEQETGAILKKPTKVSKEDRQKWNIPAAISNWKNNSGFTIALDKRVIGGAGGAGPDGNSDDALNVEKFGALSQALTNAEVQAREDISRRNELRQQLELREKRQRQDRIREIANRNDHKRRRY